MKCFTFVRVKFFRLKLISFFLTLLCYTCFCFAQVADLPAMLIETKDANNTITWNCQYDGVKSIAIQRSTDSVRNFVTIGVVNKPKKGISTYTDTKPVSGKNYYRLSVNFSGDLEWFSNTYRVFLDSATIARSIEKAIQSGTSNSILPDPNATAKPGTDKTAPVDLVFRYTPSAKVFTNPYSGHINISLDDANGKRYNIRFLTPDKIEVLRIGRIRKKFLVVDKNNFNSTGTYAFELYDGTNLVESGYITIY
jgi:hypothetical protein